MKKLLYIIIAIITGLSAPGILNADNVIQGGITLDWPLLNQEEREKVIENYRNIVFENVNYRIDKDKFQEQFAAHKKDRNKKLNKAALKVNLHKIDGRSLAGFYFLGKFLTVYAVKYDDDKKHIYYYDVLGRLAYVDIFEKPYDVFPNIAYQYKKNGKLAGISYYLSDYDQFIYKARGKFNGRWYGSKLYDKKAKIIMTRKLPY